MLIKPLYCKRRVNRFCRIKEALNRINEAPEGEVSKALDKMFRKEGGKDTEGTKK